jgi:integrase
MSKQRGLFEKEPGSGIWWIRYFDAEGKKHCEKVGRWTAAKEAYHQRKLEISEGRFRPPRARRLTFADLLDQAFADRKQRLSPHTYAADQYRAELLLEWFGRLEAEKVSKDTDLIDGRLQELLATGLAGGTVNRYKALLSAVFNWGMKRGKVHSNAARNISNYREPRLRKRFLSAEEESELRRVIQENYPECEPELDVALYTGMRRNELYRLTWDCVDLEGKRLTVQGKEHANSAQSGERILRINDTARAAFEQLRVLSNGSPYVCPGPHTGAETDRDWRDWFEVCIKKAGIQDFTYHDLRHTFASRLRMLGVELADIAELLGHRSLAMVMRYAHVSEEYQRKTIEKLVPPPSRPSEEGAVPKVVSITRGSHPRSDTRTDTKKLNEL